MVLLLLGAYRSLAGAPLRPADAGALLISLQSALRASVDGLSAALASADSSVDDPDAARNARRASASVQQRLEQLPPAADLEDADAAARVLLAEAAEDVGWGWRMVQAHVTNPGITAAVAALAAHAADCCDQARDLLVGVPAGEPPHSS